MCLMRIRSLGITYRCHTTEAVDRVVYRRVLPVVALHTSSFLLISLTEAVDRVVYRRVLPVVALHTSSFLLISLTEAVDRVVHRRVLTVLALHTSTSPTESVKFDGWGVGEPRFRLIFVQDFSSLMFLIWPSLPADDQLVDRLCFLVLSSRRLFDVGLLASLLWLMASPADGVLRVFLARVIETLGLLGEATPSDDDALR
ncbi:hypothetical protein MTO96_020232 [Rhipicephalus appendiculatus]